MTEEEEILWEKLRNRRFFNLKFLRQHPVIYDKFYSEPLFYIADFYCAEERIIIEVDGKIHDFRKAHDFDRDTILQGMNLNVLRIKNEEIKNIEVVMDKIKSFIFDFKLTSGGAVIRVLDKVIPSASCRIGITSH